MKTELLLLIPNSEPYCKNKKALINFLKGDEQIVITGTEHIKLCNLENSKELVSAKIRVKSGSVKSKEERYFQITLECDNSELLDEFGSLCNRVHNLVQRISPGNIVVNTLWDDVGRIYAENAYPSINEVENLMRKLIAEFMLVTVGINWSKERLDTELIKKIENFKDDDPFLNDLYKLDFIQLKNVLFEKKRDIEIDEMEKLISKTNFNEDDKKHIKKFIPKSNWEKYFSSLIDEKESSLSEKWRILYELRNKVAHNRCLKKEEYQKIKGLSLKIKSIIEKASEKLGAINVTEEDRETIIHNYYSSFPMDFYSKAEEAVVNYYLNSGYKVDVSNIGRDVDVDFIAEKDGVKIGVEVKITRHSMGFHHGLIQRLQKALEREDLLKVHLVFALKESGSYRKYPSHIIQALSSQNIEIYFGIVNDDGVFIPGTEME